MRRVLLVLSLMAVVAMVMAAMGTPALARGPSGEVIQNICHTAPPFIGSGDPSYEGKLGGRATDIISCK